MRFTLVPTAVAASCFLTSHVAPGHSKILLPSMLSGMFFGTNTPETPALADVSATLGSANDSDAPSAGDELVASKISGSADLVPKQEVIQELAQQADQVSPGQDEVATQSEVRAAEAETVTEKLVSAANKNGNAVSSQAVVGQEASETVETAAPVTLEKQQITEDDAAKNSELLRSVSESAEASWISKVTKQSATEALLPLVALTPVLAAAGFHADIDSSSPGAPVVRFPSIDYAVRVEDLQNYT